MLWAELRYWITNLIMKKNLINMEESLRFDFQNKKYVSNTYRIVRYEDAEFFEEESDGQVTQDRDGVYHITDWLIY